MSDFFLTFIAENQSLEFSYAEAKICCKILDVSEVEYFCYIPE